MPHLPDIDTLMYTTICLANQVACIIEEFLSELSKEEIISNHAVSKR